MAVSIDTIRSFIERDLQDIHVHDTTPDLFFFRGGERKFPFATIVTHDDEHDWRSELDREGVFRLNFATDKKTFLGLFPEISTRSNLESADYDYKSFDILFPHPIYGRMRWVSIVNPESRWGECMGLLRNAYILRELRPDSW